MKLPCTVCIVAASVNSIRVFAGSSSTVISCARTVPAHNPTASNKKTPERFMKVISEKSHQHPGCREGHPRPRRKKATRKLTAGNDNKRPAWKESEPHSSTPG